MNYLERFKVPPGTWVKLKDIDPAFKDRQKNPEEAAEEIERYQKRLCELQERRVNTGGRKSRAVH